MVNHWDLFSSNNTLLTKYRRQRKRNKKKMLWLTFHIFVNNRSPFERHQTTHMWIRYGKRIRTNCPSVATRTLYSLYRYLQTCILAVVSYIIAYAYDLRWKVVIKFDSRKRRNYSGFQWLLRYKTKLERRIFAKLVLFIF